MEITVADIMRKKFAFLKKTDSLTKAIDLFIHNPEMVFPVLDDNKRVVGEIHQHELLKLAVPAKYIRDGHVLGPEGVRDVLERSGKTVGDLMATHNVKVRPDVTVTDVARLMLETDVNTLEVVDGCGKPIGFISELDVLKYLKKKLERKAK